ncbi:BamA/TamA family outer membrane protein [Subsaxibacter sp. CAU 1640]|uniref:translocation and assembly module lipoprotein TamL n=1 Tax=Subsaxibacter sp. CAU 1640 TaxID=2933271 RepID=UPI002004DCCD|nr:BamA/TamA family outer membrane protein [Subsaxibacter sp. CAU 1640]MCK7590208.1 BamA/TamA family outer membrane protein [Subsaxibacter sp. CAU 1640]
MLLSSCNAIKRVKDGEHLLTKNTVYVNDKKNSTEVVNNLIYQRPNGKLLGYPLRLHLYNLARPNIDSILNAKYRNPDNPRTGQKKLLSLKQYEALINAKKNINTWWKKTGEAPVIVKEDKAEKSKTLLRQYYFSKGWFNAKTSYTINKTDDQRATVEYFVETGTPYVLDSLNAKISTTSIDSLYHQNLKNGSLLKAGQQYDDTNFGAERSRLTEQLRNLGYFHFGQDYISFVIDTVNTNHKVNTELVIQNRMIRNVDSVTRRPFKAYTIKEVNIFTDDRFENKDAPITDSLTYNNYNIYSYDKLKYRPKALTDAIFITKDRLFRDIDRTRTYRYLSELKVFKYPNIEYIENEADSSLVTNIYLIPKKKFGLNFTTEVSTSNIQTIGFSFSTGLLIRNVFKGAEIFEIGAIGSIGASKDSNNPEDAFFDINEIGANMKLTIPRIFFPLKTEKLIPKFMSPSTRISAAATSQRNIGLDRQTFTGAVSYNWYPSRKVTNTLDLFNVQYVKNLNTDNYFRVYQNSFNSLNDIAQSIGYVNNNDQLDIPEQADAFISDVLSQNTSLDPEEEAYQNVSNISERKNRLTEDNLIFSSSFNYVKNRRENLFDNDFSILRFRGELAGNLLSNISKIAGFQKNENDKYEVFGVAFSQYIKAEFDYVKYWDLGHKNVFAIRSYLGIAVPYGNSTNIPFAKSFFAGGPNDNRAWTAYNLGPGSSRSINEFNEANFKLHFSAEQRFNIVGSFYGALFADAGNIWNIYDDTQDESATFDGLSSLKDIALGSGIGLRYDFSFFVLRFDVGFKTYNPAYELGNRWFKDYNFSKAVFNIGINYPF